MVAEISAVLHFGGQIQPPDGTIIRRLLQEHTRTANPDVDLPGERYKNRVQVFRVSYT